MLIQILNFNSIVSQPAVVTGWKVILALCNMFFIIILLVISFATVLRVESYSAKQLLGKLLIAAVLINFSKTICGAIIEASQVIMLSFANTITTGGGIASLLSANAYLSYSQTALQNEKSIEMTGGLLGMTMAIFFLLIATIVILVLAAILLFRIMLLWIYVVLSPLAFLLSTFPAGQQYASKWWTQFTEQIVTGPVLTFFIWLAFSINTTTLTDSTVRECSSIIPTKIMCPDKLLNFAIAISFLIGGVIITQQMGGAAGAIAGRGMSAIKGVGKGTKKAAKLVGRKLGTTTLGAIGKLSPKPGSTQKGVFSKIGKTAKSWQEDVLKSRSEEKINKRKATLKKLGMSDNTQAALGEIADTKTGRAVKTTASVAATALSAITGNFIPALATGALAIHQTRKLFSSNKKKERDEEVQKSEETQNNAINKAAKELTDAIKALPKPEDIDKERDTELKEADKTKSNEEHNNRDNKSNAIQIATDDRNRDLNTLELEKATITTGEYDSRKDLIKNQFQDKKIEATTAYSNQTIIINEKHTTSIETAKSNHKQETEGRNTEEERLQQIYKEQADAARSTHKDKKSKIENVGMIEKGANIITMNWGNHHPNKVTMDVANSVNKEKEQAKKLTSVIAGGESITQMPGSTFYSPAGQTSIQKKRFETLASGTASANSAIASIGRDLARVLSKIDDGTAIDKRTLSNIQSLKQGVAAYSQGGGNTSQFTDIIDKLDKIKTGDGTDPKHNNTVDDFKSSVL